MTKEQAKAIATAIVNRLLNKGLPRQWRERHPTATADLWDYDKDMIDVVAKDLERIEIK